MVLEFDGYLTSRSLSCKRINGKYFGCFGLLLDILAKSSTKEQTFSANNFTLFLSFNKHARVFHRNITVKKRNK